MAARDAGAGSEAHEQSVGQRCGGAGLARVGQATVVCRVGDRAEDHGVSVCAGSVGAWRPGTEQRQSVGWVCRATAAWRRRHGGWRRGRCMRTLAAGGAVVDVCERTLVARSSR